MNKHCKGCNRTLPLTEFFKKKQAKDGYNHRCKDCVSVQQKNRRIKKKAQRAEPQAPPKRGRGRPRKNNILGDPVPVPFDDDGGETPSDDSDSDSDTWELQVKPRSKKSKKPSPSTPTPAPTPAESAQPPDISKPEPMTKDEITLSINELKELRESVASLTKQKNDGKLNAELQQLLKSELKQLKEELTNQFFNSEKGKLLQREKQLVEEKEKTLREIARACRF